jgi:hypothetical protein
MRLPGDAAVGEQELAEEPDPEEGHRRNRHDANEEERHDLVTGEQHKICTHHRSNGPRCPDQRDREVGVDRHKAEGRRDPAQEVEGRKAQMTKGLLDIVAEDPQAPQVEHDMGDPGVQEHRNHHRPGQALPREDHRWVRSIAADPGADLRSRQRLSGRNLASDRRVFVDELFQLGSRTRLTEEDEDVDGDDQPHHQRSDGRRIDVADWEH